MSIFFWDDVKNNVSKEQLAEEEYNYIKKKILGEGFILLKLRVYYYLIYQLAFL